MPNFIRLPIGFPKLRSEDASPYAEAEPKVNLQELAETLEALKNLGYTIGVITWLGMRASKQYKQATRQAKAEWLKKIPFTFDEIHMVQYGTPKHKIAKIKNSVLVDDNKDVREAWEKKWWCNHQRRARNMAQRIERTGKKTMAKRTWNLKSALLRPR